MVNEQSNTSKCLRRRRSEPTEERWERSRAELEKQRQRAGIQIGFKEKESTSFMKKKDEIPQLMRGRGHDDYPL